MSNSKIVSKTLSKLHFIIRKIQNSVLARSLSTIFTKNVKRSLFRRLTPIVTFLHNNCKSLIMRTLRTIIHIRIMPFNFHYSIFALKKGFPGFPNQSLLAKNKTGKLIPLLVHVSNITLSVNKCSDHMVIHESWYEFRVLQKSGVAHGVRHHLVHLQISHNGVTEIGGASIHRGQHQRQVSSEDIVGLLVIEESEGQGEDVGCSPRGKETDSHH